jgi:hypothetical protein
LRLPAFRFRRAFTVQSKVVSSELVTDGAQEGASGVDIGLRLDADRCCPVDDSDDPAAGGGDRDEDLDRVCGLVDGHGLELLSVVVTADLYADRAEEVRDGA